MLRPIAIAATILLFSTFVVGQTHVSRVSLDRMNVHQRAAYFEQEIVTAALRHDIDPKFLWTIAYLETRFRPWLTSPKGAKGMMQFIPATAERFGLRDPFEPVASIHAAARYVRLLSDRFGGRIESILAAYNSGEGAVSAYLVGRSIRTERKVINISSIRTAHGVPPYMETRNYVRDGLRIYSWLAAQHKFDQIAAPTTSPAENRTNASTVSVVFYDARSGARYSISDRNDTTRLPESGPIVISPETRKPAGSPARTIIFFANQNQLNLN